MLVGIKQFQQILFLLSWMQQFGFQKCLFLIQKFLLGLSFLQLFIGMIFFLKRLRVLLVVFLRRFFSDQVLIGLVIIIRNKIVIVMIFFFILIILYEQINVDEYEVSFYRIEEVEGCSIVIVWIQRVFNDVIKLNNEFGDKSNC